MKSKTSPTKTTNLLKYKPQVYQCKDEKESHFIIVFLTHAKLSAVSFMYQHCPLSFDVNLKLSYSRTEHCVVVSFKPTATLREVRATHKVLKALENTIDQAFPHFLMKR